MFAFETAGALAEDGTSEPLLWQQMRPDRYKASRLWFLRANLRGLSEGTEPWGT